MCTALVVREEYWDRQVKVCANLCGYRLSKIQIDVVKRIFEDCCRKVVVYIRELVDVCIQVFNAFKDTLKETIESLSKLFKSCEITPDDDFDVVCDKLENKMVYLNRQNCIKQEQYYKAQFKLAKVNYNIMKHDRRC